MTSPSEQGFKINFFPSNPEIQKGRWINNLHSIDYQFTTKFTFQISPVNTKYSIIMKDYWKAVNAASGKKKDDYFFDYPDLNAGIYAGTNKRQTGETLKINYIT